MKCRYDERDYDKETRHNIFLNVVDSIKYAYAKDTWHGTFTPIEIQKEYDIKDTPIWTLLKQCTCEEEDESKIMDSCLLYICSVLFPLLFGLSNGGLPTNKMIKLYEWFLFGIQDVTLNQSLDTSYLEKTNLSGYILDYEHMYVLLLAAYDLYGHHNGEDRDFTLLCQRYSELPAFISVLGLININIAMDILNTLANGLLYLAFDSQQTLMAKGAYTALSYAIPRSWLKEPKGITNNVYHFLANKNIIEEEVLTQKPFFIWESSDYQMWFPSNNVRDKWKIPADFNISRDEFLLRLYLFSYGKLKEAVQMKREEAATFHVYNYYNTKYREAKQKYRNELSAKDKAERKLAAMHHKHKVLGDKFVQATANLREAEDQINKGKVIEKVLVKDEEELQLWKTKCAKLTSRITTLTNKLKRKDDLSKKVESLQEECDYYKLTLELQQQEDQCSNTTLQEEDMQLLPHIKAHLVLPWFKSFQVLETMLPQCTISWIMSGANKTISIPSNKEIYLFNTMRVAHSIYFNWKAFTNRVPDSRVYCNTAGMNNILSTLIKKHKTIHNL